MKIVFGFFICLFLSLSSLAQIKNSLTVVPSNLRAVVSLADHYIKDGEKRLEGKDKETVQQMKIWLNTIKAGLPTKLRENVNDLVNKLTIALVDMKSTDGLTVASAYLIRYDSTNLRTENLFGAVLHITFRLKDAATVFEYMHHVDSTNVSTSLSLANIYIDINKDSEAKKLLDKLIKLEQMLKLDAGDTRALYKTLAIYWYKKGNLTEWHEALLKSSTFEGFVQHKNEEADKPVDDNEVKQGDGLGQMESKLDKLKESVPLNVADILEKDYPAEANKIRDRLGKLQEDDRMKLGLFPQANTSSNKGYLESFPIIGEWIKAFAEKYADFVKQDALVRMGINTNESEEAIKKKGEAYAKKEMTKSLQGTEDMMKYMKEANLPGMDKNAINNAMAQVNAAAKQNGVKLEDKPVDLNEIPTFDSGTPFAKENYRKYFLISKSYENYLTKYFKHYHEEVQDILKVYQEKMFAEQKNHDDIQDGIEKNYRNKDIAVYDVKTKEETLRNKKAMNGIGDAYYKFWANLYIPQYDQKMKPTLEAYWSVCALYIKNMNSIQVAVREYDRVKSIYLNTALTAITDAGVGAGFAYFGTTEEEEAALAKAIADAEEEAKTKNPVFMKDVKVHAHHHINKSYADYTGIEIWDRDLKEYPERKDDFLEWMEKNWVFEVSGEFLSVKVTCRTIEFEAWAFGPTAAAKIDLLDATLETSTSVSAKAHVGIKIMGKEIGQVEVKAEGFKRSAKFDFANGKYEETINETVKAEAKASLGPISGSSEYEVNIDNLQSKYTGKISVNASDMHGSDQNTSVAGQVLKGAFKDMSLSLYNESSTPPVKK